MSGKLVNAKLKILNKMSDLDTRMQMSKTKGHIEAMSLIKTGLEIALDYIKKEEMK